LIEWATGFHGYLFRHEWNFYVLEALPMILATGVFVVWYPPHHIPTTPKVVRVKQEVNGRDGYRLATLEDGPAR
jgi:hypothetical protein